MSVKDKVAKLFQPKGVPMTKAQEAFLAYSETDNVSEFIAKVCKDLQGRIQSLNWRPQKTGVAEQTIIHFPDNTGIKINRFLNKNKSVVIKVNSL